MQSDTNESGIRQGPVEPRDTGPSDTGVAAPGRQSQFSDDVEDAAEQHYQRVLEEREVEADIHFAAENDFDVADGKDFAEAQPILRNVRRALQSAPEGAGANALAEHLSALRVGRLRRIY